jgi:hypothetical protein
LAAFDGSLVQRLGMKPQCRCEFAKHIRVQGHDVRVAPANPPGLLKCRNRLVTPPVVGVPIPKRHPRGRRGQVVACLGSGELEQLIDWNSPLSAPGHGINGKRTDISIIVAHARVEQPFGVFEHITHVAKAIVTENRE